MSDSNHRTSIVSALLLAFTAFAPASLAQCDLLIRESFRPGLRPHGNNGRERDAAIHDTLSGYWPQVPSDGTRWIATDQTGVPSWGFAGSSLDPAEVDPLDPYNGTAFGDATATALLPFVAPATIFTASAEVVQLFGSTSATYLGYTSSPTLLNNFETSGALWISLNGRGEWAIHTNGNAIVASGTAPIVGTLNSGWLHVELSFDPVASMAWGRVMDTDIAPIPVTLTTPILYFGMEAHDSWNVINNISVYKGAPIHISLQAPLSVRPGDTVQFQAVSNAADPAEYFWSRDGLLLEDGLLPSGAMLSGSHSNVMTLTGVSLADAGSYACTVSNACGVKKSDSTLLTVCAADFNADGSVDFFDYLDFVDSFSSGSTVADFNGDGVIDFFDYLDFVDSFSAGC